MSMKQSKWVKMIEKKPYLHFLCKSLSRIWKRDLNYIQFALNEYSNPRRLTVQKLGDNNRGSLIYVIREQGNGYGFFAELRSLLCELLFAEELGMIPHVFWGENHVYYEGEKENVSANVFENYFLPVSVDECLTSRNIVMSSSLQCKYIEDGYHVQGYISSEAFDEALVSVLKKYIHIKPELICEFEKDRNSFFQDARVLGIHHRGTDYKEGYSGHPAAVDFYQEIDKAKKLLKKYDLQYVFLATDDKDVIEQYQSEFGGNVKFYQNTYRSNGKESIAFSSSDRELHHYLLGKEVLRDVYMLSKCNVLLSGKSQVSYFARLFNSCDSDFLRYEQIELIDNGINKGTKYFKRKQ